MAKEWLTVKEWLALPGQGVDALLPTMISNDDPGC